MVEGKALLLLFLGGKGGITSSSNLRKKHMPNLNYAKAAEYERGLVKNLMMKGALYATRTPGSRSPIDVIAIFSAVENPLLKPGNPEVHVIQCKLGKSQPKRSEIDFLRFMREKGCEAYFITRQYEKGKKRIMFKKVTLEQVEDGKIGPIKENGNSETVERHNETRKGLKKPTKKRRAYMTEGDLGSPISLHYLKRRR